ncbi:hypothetical protein SAFG77S_05433 [Streptomyces afghaniensis]
MAENTPQPEDIAVVGMACRYPGGMNTPERLWALVNEGRDVITDFPDNREWHTEDLYDPSFVRQGGFLHDADLFDADFFGIRPAEAISMDPQQRVLLQVTWEAIERAGIVPSSLKGSQTGVFVGLMPNEYGMPLWKWQDETAGFMGTGTSPSVASGRIAYLLGLEGPALTIDTACSSSGVAIHTAVRSLRSGETDLALAGGCTVLTGPGMFVDYAKKGALLTGRTLSYLLRHRQRNRLGRRCGRPRPRAPLGGPAQSAPHPRRHQGNRRQSGRREQRPHRTERQGSGQGDPAGARRRPAHARRDPARGGARYGHQARRSHRGQRHSGHLRSGPRGRARVDRLVQVEHRPLHGRRGSRRCHQVPERDARRHHAQDHARRGAQLPRGLVLVGERPA